MYASPCLCIHTHAHRLLRQAEMQAPVHLRPLEGRQNICLLLLLCSCNKRSCGERKLEQDQIKTSACMESVAVPAGQSLFPLTLNRDLKGGAVTLVFCCHLTPVATSISRDHFDNLHFISIDLGEKIWRYDFWVISERRGSDHTVHKMDVSA